MAANYSITMDPGFSYVEIRNGKVDIYDGIQCDLCGSDMTTADGHELIWHETEKFTDGRPLVSALRCVNCGTVHSLDYEGI